MLIIFNGPFAVSFKFQAVGLAHLADITTIMPEPPRRISANFKSRIPAGMSSLTLLE